MKLTLNKRKEFLKRILPEDGLIRESKSFDTSVSQFLKTAKKMGLEGMIAKRSDSLYCPGERSHYWLKIKVQQPMKLYWWLYQE